MSKEVKDIREIFSKATGEKIGYWTKEKDKYVLVSTMKDSISSVKTFDIDKNGRRVLVKEDNFV
tara:strand:+ start:4949 stop:5140 length:192 start_codon:yes stop_codon:yes gene_type:complete